MQDSFRCVGVLIKFGVVGFGVYQGFLVLRCLEWWKNIQGVWVSICLLIGKGYLMFYSVYCCIRSRFGYDIGIYDGFLKNIERFFYSVVVRKSSSCCLFFLGVSFFWEFFGYLGIYCKYLVSI